MENPRSPLLTWPFYYQAKSMEELRQSLFYTTLELESTRLTAQEEITKREQEIIHLQQLLNKSIKERDEAQDKYRHLVVEKLLVQQNHHPKHSANSSIEDEPNLKKDGFSTLSDCEESIVSSPPRMATEGVLPENALQVFSPKKPLPEKGKLLQAMMNAGPLLQTLLLAGPLPQWRHPPPPLETFEIPPVQIPGGDGFRGNEITNCGAVSNKKRNYDGGASSESNKYQRILFH
ncbi:uncharacterized protein LOC141596119 [Silene latifolia]|uniref:uncharacterized protein LOC141596119 n=1 Tax=Silene latifolia TaxID=37657 RepID=UPI003D782C5D